MPGKCPGTIRTMKTEKEFSMKKTLRTIIQLILFIFIFQSLSYSQELTATDDTGFTLHLLQPPQRIISLSPGNTEILFALGLGEKVMGVTTYCNEPQEALTKEKIGNVTEIDLEKILTLQPDLILASSLTPDEAIVRLRELNLSVFILKSESIAQVIEDIQKVSILGGVESAGQALAQTLQEKMKQITDKTNSLTDTQKPVVFHIIWHDPIWTAGNHTFINEFITLAGGKNLAGDLNGYSTVDIEEIIRRNPAIITVIESHGGSDQSQLYQFVTTDSRFQSMDAIKNQQVYLVDSDIVSRPGPRLITALEFFAQIIHPELFGKYEFKNQK